jgi:ABC-type antimicrobial peptide transport system permease subunit
MGYGRARVVSLVLCEALAVAVVGGTFGALAAYALFATGRVEIPGAGFAYRSDVSVVVRAALFSIPLGLVAGAQPAWSAVRMTISDALRYTE